MIDAARTAASRPHATGAQEGTVLVVLMILFVCFAGFVTASLTSVVAEDHKTTHRLYALQAQVMANSQLELAKNLVNASPYNTDMENEVLLAAVARADRMIAGTQVRVERIGTTGYFRLTTTAAHMGVLRNSEAVVRQTSPASSYNLFVIDHPVGLSGRPRGAIHTNKYIDFYFRNGLYQDQVTAGEGFNFVAGATQENTRFTGVTNPNAPAYDILANVDFDSLASRATALSVTENLISEVQFNGNEVEVKLFQPAYQEQYQTTRTRTRLLRYDTETYVEQEPVYTETPYTVTVPVYTTETYVTTESQPVYATRTVTRTYQEPVYADQTVSYTVQVPVYGTRTATRDETVRVWVPLDEGSLSGSAGTVGSSTQLAGYWRTETVQVQYQEQYVERYETETRYRTDRVLTGYNSVSRDELETYVSGYTDVPVTRTRQVQTGTRDETRILREITGYVDVTKTRQVPVYETYTETVTRTRWVAETLVRTERVPADGVIYLKGDVRKMAGQLNGRVSLITSGKVRLTGSVQYVDDAGQTRMANGVDPTQPYTDNPSYAGNSLLAVMAKGDIVYAKECPERMEVNASLISAGGAVGFEGITVSVDGREVSTSLDTRNATYVRDSLRRLGGIVSRYRPVATYIDEYGNLGAGFETGESVMDQNLLLTSGNNAPPPFMFEGAQPTWILQTSGQKLGVID
ncbi:MAG: hypothetical protein IT458_06980 [Planctomycetes bacterium]|nr:hypothetical protein [Planctomycetota bacterium]